jgi:hypothetical protein
MKKTPVERLLGLAIKAAKSSRVEYAIGGAFAMRAHGYSRETQDVDVFVLPSESHRYLLALRKLGLQVVSLMSNIHYAAYLPESTNKEQRIDVILPYEDLEMSAVQFSKPMKIMEKSAQVFQMDYVIATKFCADRPRDERDILDMLYLGFFDPVSAHRLIQTIDKSEAKRFQKFIEKALEIKPKKNPFSRKNHK